MSIVGSFWPIARICLRRHGPEADYLKMTTT